MGSDATVTAVQPVNIVRLVNGCIVRGVDPACAIEQQHQQQATSSKQKQQQQQQQQHESAADRAPVELVICDERGVELDQKNLQADDPAPAQTVCHGSKEELPNGRNWVPLAWAPEHVQAQFRRREHVESDEDIPVPRDRRLNGQLQELLLARIRRERRLWHNCDDYERRLRSRCLRDQLCRKADMKYVEVISGIAGGWDEYLRTSAGHQRTVQWAERKIKETLDRETSKRRRTS